MSVLPVNSGTGRPLFGIISHARSSGPQANHFDCAVGGLAYLSNPKGPPMFEAAAAFLVILSVGILVAHALDAFRSWKYLSGYGRGSGRCFGSGMRSVTSGGSSADAL